MVVRSRRRGNKKNKDGDEGDADGAGDRKWLHHQNVLPRKKKVDEEDLDGGDSSSTPSAKLDVLEEATQTLLPAWLPRWKELFVASSTITGGCDPEGVSTLAETTKEKRRRPSKNKFVKLQLALEEAVALRKQVD